MSTPTSHTSANDRYAPLRGFEEEQARLAAGRETDYEVPPEAVTDEIKRMARREHCLATPVRGTTADGMPFLHFGEHQVMQAWEYPYMQELAEVATSALDKGDVLELGYGMGISGGYIQTAISHWNTYHPHKSRAHHISELNLDVAADCIRRNQQAIRTGRLILHVGDWRELLADLPGEVISLESPDAQKVIARWCADPRPSDQCHHIVTTDTQAALDCMDRYKEAIADAYIQLHVGVWPAVSSRLQQEGAARNHISLLTCQEFGGALLDTYALTSDERHFNQVPALRPVRLLLADGGVLTYYGDAEKEYQPLHRQSLIEAGFHPDNIDCTLFSFERYIQGSAYKNKYNKLHGMIVPRIVAGPPAHPTQKLASSRSVGYAQADSSAYHELSRDAGVAYSEGWFKGTDAPFTPEDLVSLAGKVQRLSELFGNSQPAARIIEVGCGPNLGNTIAAAPFCREYIGLERSPALVELANSWAEGSQLETLAMWEGWRELAGLCYAQACLPGGQAVQWLYDLMAKQPALYEVVRTWNQLSGSYPAKIRLMAEAAAIEQQTGQENPFLAARNVVSLVKGKTKFIAADLIEEVAGSAEAALANIQAYAGTADAVLANYVHESVNDELLGVAHSLLNTARLAKPTGIVMNTFMEKTFQYSGFLTPLNECYASSLVLEKLHEQVAGILPTSLAYTSVDPAEAGRVVRAGYAGVVACDGYRAASLPATARDMLDTLLGCGVIPLRIAARSTSRQAASGAAPVRYAYCMAAELPDFQTEALREYERLYRVSASVSRS